ncbi:SusC/RagA family TonB-linked outer membrane protein [Pedobacter ginsenosidimutans]|nr:SusC/RagA family TonB-linked outer membrane protein [Pedobacter ginsenosidimutans]
MYKKYTNKRGVPKAYLRQILLIMRLTTIVLIMAIMQVSASTFAQRITLSEKNATLRKVFDRISDQSGYNFIFTSDLLKGTKPVWINVKDTELAQVLDKIFANQPVSFSIEDKTVVIKAKEKSLFENIIANFQAIIVRGKVLDENGQPLVGANVFIKGTNRSVRTDQNGNFSIDDLPDNSVIVISYVGYKVKEVRASSDFMTIKLEPDEQTLQGVIINKGYYSTSEKLNTGSAVQISANQLQRQPLGNPLQMLQGLVPGMQIKQTSGMPGSATTVFIRGRNSINSGLIPLYVIDGIPFNGVPVDQQVGSGATTLGGQPNGFTDPLSNINTNDIESITVLKDADATAIYGSRGANGVVLITTKRGAKGKATFDVNYNSGLSEVVNQRKLLSSSEYLDLRRRAFANDNRTPTVALAPDLMLWDQNANTNYQNMLIGNTAKQNEVSTSLSMGNERSSLLLSTNYRHETSILFGNGKYQKGGFNIRATQTSADNRLKLDLGTSLGLTSNNMLGSDFASAAINIPANYPLYDSTGKLYWVTNFSNPIATSNQSVLNKGSNLLVSGNLSYKVSEHLTARVNLGYNNISQELKAKAPASTQNPLFSTPVSSGIYSETEGKVYIAEPQLDYQTKIWKGILKATLGGAWQQSKNNQPYFINANTFASESLMDSYTNAANFTTVRSLNSEYRYVSGFGILNYNLLDKYVVNVVFRRDGSSRFGPGNKYGNFGSIGWAWNFADEKFIQNLNLFSYGKLRGSYGVTGNDQFENYSFMDTYTSTTSSYGGNPGFYPTRLANQDFKWEANRKMEVGLELGFLKDRIRFTSSFYRNRSDNMVVRNAPLPAQTGFSTYITNLDALVQNQGVEFDLNATPIKSPGFTWDVSFNLSISRNKLLSLPDELFTLYGNTYAVGSSLNSYVVYQNTGFVNGVAQFQDRNGNGAVTSGLTNDSYVAGTRDPQFYGGLASAISYKGLRLDILVNFTKQTGVNQIAFPGLLGSQLDDLRDTQFKPSSLTSSAAYSSYVNYAGSDAVLTDASFIRLRNVSLSYNLPEKWLGAIKSKRAQIYLRGQNIYTITGYKGLDPETQGSVLPPLKMFVAGLQFTL